MAIVFFENACYENGSHIFAALGSSLLVRRLMMTGCNAESSLHTIP